MKKTGKRVLSLSLSAAMAVTLLPMTALADGEKSVTVTVRAQAAGDYLAGFSEKITVASNEAEQYGFTDSVSNGVSALDALVAEHKVIYGTEDFTKDTANDYLSVSSSGFVSKIFGISTYANGFLINEGYPNDGTESSYGGYNGTTVSTQDIKDGDVVDFFSYTDEDTYMDQFSFVDVKESAEPKENLDVTVTGNSVMMGYLYGTPEEFKDGAAAIEGATLCWVDTESGAATAIAESETDKDGKASITAPEEAGEYYLAAAGDEDVPVIKNPTKITVSKEEAPDTPAEATTLVLDQTSVKVGVGKEATVNATTDLEGAEITWSSSDEEVATVDNGKITGLEAGKAVITAKCGELTATCSVKVIETAVKLSQKSLELEDGEKAKLTAKVTTADADPQVTWKSSKEKVATVDKDGTVTGVSEGTAVITASCDGAEDVCIVTVTAVGKTSAISIEPGEGIILGQGFSSVTPAFISSEDSSFTLKAKVDEGTSTKVTWSSNNSKYPIDENGVVTVPKTTSSTYVTFTAASKYNSSVKATYAVYILPTLSIASSYQNINITIPTDGRILSNDAYIKVSPDPYHSYRLADWTIEDESVASIDASGTSVCFVIPKKAGTTTVTATGKDSADNKVTATVTVKGFLITDEAGTSVKKTMSAGEKATLSANTESALTWSSSDDSVVAVDENGAIEAKANGNATISASDGDYTATYKILVKDANALYPDKLYTSSYSSLYTDEAATTKLTSSADYLTDSATYKTTAHWFDVSDTSKQQLYAAQGTSALSIYMGVVFDDTKMKAEIMQDDKVVATLKSATTSTVSVKSGTTEFTVRVTSLEDETVYTEYPFAISRKECTTATLKSAVVRPEDRNANSTVTFKGRAEGTLFRYNASGAITTTAGFAAATYRYRAYVYSDVKAVTLTAATTDTLTGHLAYSVDNGETWTEGEASSVIKATLSEEGEATVLVKAVADADYKAAKAAGEDPYAAVTNVYTFEIERISEEATKDASLLSLTYSDGCTEATPGFAPTRAFAGALVSHDAPEMVTLTFTAKNGVDVYKTSKSTANKLTAVSTDEETGISTYQLDVKVALSSNSTQVTQKIIVDTKDADGNAVQSSCTVYLFKVGNTSGVLSGVADKVVDYLCAGSQYSAGGNTAYGLYGVFPEKSLMGGGNWNSCISLGNYGGYVTYYYEDGIKDDSKNPYGIDLTVFGNSNGGQSFAEPGSVWVSEDGKDWYELAGSEHYDASTVWNYKVTYKKSNSATADYEDNMGNGGTLGSAFSPLQFPEKQWYPLCNLYGDNDSSVTVSGTRLYGPTATKGMGEEIVASGAATMPAWGYADVHTNSSSVAGTGEDVNLLTTPVGNPYTSNYDKFGDGFDLEWAVDAEGMPVDVSNKEFHYVKVQTASFINAGIFGEKSAEVNAVVKTKAEAADQGVTAAPESIKVGDTTLALSADKDVYYVQLDKEATYDVVVNASSNANVYINNQRGNTRSYTGLPDKDIFRIVVQEGNASPAIYYVKAVVKGEDAVADVIAAIDALSGVSKDELSEKVAEIQKAYDALTDEEKAQVTNIDELNAKQEEAKVADVQKMMDEATGADAVKAANDAYNALTEEEQAQIANKADFAEKAIDAIGEVTTDSKDVIALASEIYGSLTADEQAEVGNAQTLKDAIQKLEVLGLEKQVKELRFQATTVDVTSNVVYSGKEQTPAVKVTLFGEALKENVDYTIAYKDNKDVGMATITLTGTGNYIGTKDVNFNILPKSVSLKSVKAGKKKITVKWNKATDTQVTGYQIRYSTSKTLSKAKTVTVKSSTAASKVVKKLKAGKKYYVQVRVYKTVNGKNYASAWSKSKKAKVKK